MLVAAGAVFSALALTWIIHLVLLNAGIDLSPLFYYEYTWSPWQILGTILVFSLPISFFGNLLSLSPERSKTIVNSSFRDRQGQPAEDLTAIDQI